MWLTTVGGDSIILNEAQTGHTIDNNLNGLDQLVADIKPDDSDYVEYVDEEERDYQELISNKSGNRFNFIGLNRHNPRSFFFLLFAARHPL